MNETYHTMPDEALVSLTLLGTQTMTLGLGVKRGEAREKPEG